MNDIGSIWGIMDDACELSGESALVGPCDDVVRFKVGQHYRVYQHGCVGESSFHFIIEVRDRATFSDGRVVMDVNVIPCPYQNVLIPYVRATVDVRVSGAVEKVVSRMFGGDCRCSATDVAERRWC